MNNDLNYEDYAKDRNYFYEVLKRNCTFLQRERIGVVGHHYNDFTSNLLYSTGEIFVEFETSPKHLLSRVEGFCVKFEESDGYKDVTIWCTKNNEAITIRLEPYSVCRVGDVNNHDLYKTTGICMDCKEEFIDCHCVR